MGQSGVSVRTMSHKCGRYESEWSGCERRVISVGSMSQNGVIVREKKRVHVNHNRYTLEYQGFLKGFGPFYQWWG